jgi:hypothetical protein
VGVGVGDVGLTGEVLATAGDWTLVVGACPPDWLLHALSTIAVAQASAPHHRLRAIIMIKRYVLCRTTAPTPRRILSASCGAVAAEAVEAVEVPAVEAAAR